MRLCAPHFLYYCSTDWATSAYWEVFIAACVFSLHIWMREPPRNRRIHDISGRIFSKILEWIAVSVPVDNFFNVVPEAVSMMLLTSLRACLVLCSCRASLTASQSSALLWAVHILKPVGAPPHTFQQPITLHFPKITQMVWSRALFMARISFLRIIIAAFRGAYELEP